MDIMILKHINELFNSYDLFSDTGKNNIYNSIKRKFPNINEEEINEIKEYLNGFYECCLNFANIIANKYKTPVLPKNEEVKTEITKYMKKCQKQYPEIDKEHIIEFFSTVCWLSNR